MLGCTLLESSSIYETLQTNMLLFFFSLPLYLRYLYLYLVVPFGLTRHTWEKMEYNCADLNDFFSLGTEFCFTFPLFSFKFQVNWISAGNMEIFISFSSHVSINVE